MFRKKNLFMFFMLIAFFCMSLRNQNPVLAAETPEVYAEKMTIGENAEFKIPVLIKNNTGIMGFRITVTFASSDMSITNIESASLTGEGLFNTSLKNDGSTSIDVLWSGTENVSEDGELFYIYGKTSEQLADNASIDLAYTKEDTFNEEFEPVTLKCDSIPLNYDEDEAGQTIEEEPQEEYLANEVATEVKVSLSDDDVKNTIDTVLKDLKVSDIKNITPEQAKKVVEALTEKIKETGGSTENIDSLLEQIENSASGNKTSDDNASDNKVSDDTVSGDSTSDIPASEGSVSEDTFVKIVQKINSDLSDDSKSEEAEISLDKTVNNATGRSGNGKGVIVGVVMIVILLGLIIGVVVFRTRKGKK